MKLEELALCTREEFEKQLNKMCPDSNCMDPGEYDAVFSERVRIRNSIKRLRIEALLDGKLTVDQVAVQGCNQTFDSNCHVIGNFDVEIVRFALFRVLIK